MAGHLPDDVSSNGVLSSVWLGESAHTLDDKARVFIPRKFQAGFGRDAEGRTVVYVTRGFEGCLALYSEEGFQRVLGRLEIEAFSGQDKRRMQRLFFSNSHRTTLDGSGRLLLPEKLRDTAGIARDVVLVGLVDRVEIWPKAAWEAFESDAAGDFDSLDQVLSAPGRGIPAAGPAGAGEARPADTPGPGQP